MFMKDLMVINVKLGIGFRPSQDVVPLAAGMTVTNGKLYLIQSLVSTRMESLELESKMYC